MMSSTASERVKRNKNQKSLLNFFKKLKGDNDTDTDTTVNVSNVTTDKTHTHDCGGEAEIVHSPKSTYTVSSSSTEQDVHAIHPIYDIGHAIGKKLSEIETLKFVKETWTPLPSYSFPAKVEGKQSRRFKYDWLSSYNWLAYSEVKCGCFCKYCVLFAPTGAGLGSQELNKLVKEPLAKYKNAIDDFRLHADRGYHKFSVQKASEFLKNMEPGKGKDVTTLLDKHKDAIIESNKRRLRPIIKTVIFCARNNLALRGHRDDGKMYCDKYDDALSGKEGIFRSLLAFRLDSGDVDLKYHFEIAGRNSSMISKTIQNEIIDTVGEVIRSDIISDVKSSKFYSILCDETTDISTKEQMTMCLRYVDLKKMMLKEDFVGFVELKGTTGLEIKNAITEELTKLGLSLQTLRGQGYDGGSNMSGRFNGAKALMLDQQPLAFYTHCFSHQLNLSITKSCEVQSIKNMMGIVASVSNFVKGSAKRVSSLENIISQSSIGESQKKKLKSLCPTRWVERHDSLMVFNELLSFISIFLEQLESDKDAETSSKAVSLGAALKRSDFVVSLCTAVHCLALTLKLSKFLQDPEQDLSTARGYIVTILNRLKTIRSEADEEFKQIFKSSQETAAMLGEEINLPRRCGRQTQRANVEAQDPEQYYRVVIFLPFVDHLISQLESRFCAELHKAIPLEGLIPSNFAKYTVDDVLSASKIYCEDVPVSVPELLAEVHLWRGHWEASNKEDLPKSCIEALSKCPMYFFPNVSILLQIFATLPVTTATAERSFSSLKRLKTYLRSTMNEDRLNGLALVNIHKERIVDIEEVISKFSQSKPRRMLLSNWVVE